MNPEHQRMMEQQQQEVLQKQQDLVKSMENKGVEDQINSKVKIANGKVKFGNNVKVNGHAVVVKNSQDGKPLASLKIKK